VKREKLNLKIGVASLPKEQRDFRVVGWGPSCLRVWPGWAKCFGTSHQRGWESRSRTRFKFAAANDRRVPRVG